MDIDSRIKWLTENPVEWQTSQHPQEAVQWVQWLASRQPKSLLEIGTRTGSNLYLMAGAVVSGGTVEAVDLSNRHGEARRLVEQKLREEGYTAQIHDEVDSAKLESVPLRLSEYDCVYIDGNHEYKAAISDWKQALLRVAPGGCIGFHDINHYPKTDRANCAAFWADAQAFFPPGVMTVELLPLEGAKPMGVGGVPFKDRLLFIINGGLGDAAEITRALLVASKLGYIVHVMVIAGMANEMRDIWAKVPWFVQVTREQAKRFAYKAVMCATTQRALEERASGLQYERLLNGSSVSQVGHIVQDKFNLLIELGHSKEEIEALAATVVSPFKYLLEAKNRDLVLIAPGIGSALSGVDSGGPDKRYDRWDEVIRYLPRPLAFVGNDKAREPWMEKFKDDQGVEDLIGKTPQVVDLLPVFARTMVAFCPDNGIGHLAGLFGVPTVSVFTGVTMASKFAPPEALVLESKDKVLGPGIIAGQMHYIINPDCRRKVKLLTGGLLSVIITTHNEGDEVFLTCQDVYERAGCPVEIIVVDEGSTDGSCDKLPDYVRVIRNQERTGVAPARNQGVHEATGEAFMFLDAHMRVSPETPAKMMLAAFEKKALIVPGVAPLYNSGRGANWTCKWQFKGGRLRSKWFRDCHQDFEPTDCFVAPGWVISRREWETIGPWPSSLSGWGSTEVCKGLQAFMAGVPLLAMKEAVVWHRFRNRFPYHVSPRDIQNNAYIVARIMFGERVFNEVFLPAMRSQGWDKKIEGFLKGDSMLKDIEAMETRRKVSPEEFVARYFPNGIVDENDKGKAEKPEKMEGSSSEVSKEKAVEKIDWYKTDHCLSQRNCIACRTDKEFRRVVGILFKTPNSNFDCPQNRGEDGKPRPVAQNRQKPVFFEMPNCTSKVHCLSCRNSRAFREAISQVFMVPNVDFDCPYGITKDNIAKQSFFEDDICKSKQNCKTCRTNKNFRKIIAERFNLPDGEFACPLGIVAENFQDGKFPSIVQEAMNLAKSAAKVVSDAAKGKDVVASKEEQDRRLGICEKCDIYDIARKRCRQCGCRMDMKAMLASMRCPIGKW
jgi:glycosyltransferase involved in cell wall biosynthesis/ADP-heptose:LPS heptosyltransferase/predicted O-methyltransferase YrrM